MFAIYFYRPSASGEMPVLSAVSTPSIVAAGAILAALRCCGLRARMFRAGRLLRV